MSTKIYMLGNGLGKSVISGKGNEARSYAGLVTSVYHRMFG
jgi:hypothetical protein